MINHSISNKISNIHKEKDKSNLKNSHQPLIENPTQNQTEPLKYQKHDKKKSKQNTTHGS